MFKRLNGRRDPEKWEKKELELSLTRSEQILQYQMEPAREGGGSRMENGRMRRCGMTNQNTPCADCSAE